MLIIYYCENCNIEIETSVCPICNSRSYLKESTIYWCDKCNVPSFYETCSCCANLCKKVGTDLRPVFPEERLLLECLEGSPFKYCNDSFWNLGANHYICNGKKINMPYTEFRKKANVEEIINMLNKNEENNKKYSEEYLTSNTIKKFIEVNKKRLNYISHEAIKYIRDLAENKSESEMFVSFSGGKDSTVTSHLVLNALSDKNIIHIYGDTTLEYPTSKKYIEKFKKKYPNIPMLIAKNKDQDFENLCEVIGPPSRMMRWCCTVFKTGAITKKIDSTFNESKNLITFQGIRRAESTSRNKYERESDDSKIKRQIAVSPIIDWLDFDVWLYILSNNIDFNDAYRQGFSRVGCWCCPNNSGWSEFLSSIYMNEQYIKFKNMLYKFAKKIGKPDWKKYIDDGEWKKRQGGNGLDISKKSVVSFKPCALEDNTYNFELTKPITQEIYKFFKPFGILNFDIGKKALNEVYVLNRKTKMPVMKLSGRIGTSLLKISVVGESPYFKSKKNIEMLLKNQINKYQTCIGCTYCEAVCKFGALKVFNTKKGNVSNETISYTIDESKCVGCLECVKHFANGCYINKVLKIKKEQ